MDLFGGHSLVSVIESVGYIGLFLLVFAESGLLLGFILPGDSLLIAAGFVASQGYLNLLVMITVAAVAAIIGDSVGYLFGKKIGPKIFKKEDSWLFHKDHLIKAEEFYEKHGSKTIIIARFIPFVRTFAPLLAGVGKMTYKKFVTYNIIGGITWSISFIVLGFYFGKLVPDVKDFIMPILVVLGVLMVISVLVHFLWRKHQKNKLLKDVAGE